MQAQFGVGESGLGARALHVLYSAIVCVHARALSHGAWTSVKTFGLTSGAGIVCQGQGMAWQALWMT